MATKRTQCLTCCNVDEQHHRGTTAFDPTIYTKYVHVCRFCEGMNGIPLKGLRAYNTLENFISAPFRALRRTFLW